MENVLRPFLSMIMHLENPVLIVNELDLIRCIVNNQSV